MSEKIPEMEAKEKEREKKQKEVNMQQKEYEDKLATQLVKMENYEFPFWRNVPLY